jgi:SAM-dependent methyltransferase
VEGPIDPIKELDWAAHWKRLVSERERQAGGPRSDSYWDRRAPLFASSLAGQEDVLSPVLEPYLNPSRTLIDVGAGTGRYAVPLAARLDWVTAVEPSQGMRELIPPVDNMTVIASAWEDAEVATADLVLCCHVLYGIAEPVPFIEKLEASARERVFLCLRDAEPRLPSELLWEELTGRPRARQPRFQDAYNLLRQMGVAPDVAVLRQPGRPRFPSLEAAVEDGRLHLREAWDDQRGRAWLRENLVAQPDGSVVFEGGEAVSGVAHWRPRT